ncbi:MAG: M14 family zinc carboxypeptidase, partial [Bacteroidota bacterium]
MRILLLSLLFVGQLSMAQDFADQLFADFEKVREPTLNIQRIKHAQLLPLIERFEANKDFTVRQVGQSIEGRSIYLISVGEGDTDVFLWSQMHGNEPTATMAGFDLLNMLADPKLYKKEKRELLRNATIHFLPMLNPDGAERFMRRNVLGVDINRDAQRLQTPEGQILKYVRDSLDAEFGFNLHDQSRYYNAERTEKPATISYLAPAYNYEKEVNDVRGNAMKVIVLMNDILQRYVPGQVGRYNDSFEPRAFGDNITKWGTSAILIESGGHYNDPEKQFIRKLNYMSITSAIFSIADGSYANVDIARYEE